MENGTAKTQKRSLTTTKRICGASREVFYKKGFFAATVEEIAALCGLSRGTIYLNFSSKDEILLELLREDLAHQLDVYRELAKIKRVTATSIKKWIAYFRNDIEHQRNSLNLFSYAGALRIDNKILIGQHRDNIIEILGKRFASFDIFALDRNDREIQRTKCIMILFLIEGTVINFSTDPTMPSLAVGTGVLVPILLDFLNAGRLEAF